jgi:hypothetical protein
LDFCIITDEDANRLDELPSIKELLMGKTGTGTGSLKRKFQKDSEGSKWKVGEISSDQDSTDDDMDDSDDV